MSAETKTLKELEQKFQHPYFKKRASRAINDAEEAEIMFLRPLEKENWRDVQQEMAAVGYAEMIFQMAVAQRKTPRGADGEIRPNSYCRSVSVDFAAAT
jgi:hypothetical protein